MASTCTKNRHLVATLVAMMVSGCGPLVEQSEPWWLRVVPGSSQAADAELSADGKTLWFVSAHQSPPSLTLSRVDLASPDMTVQFVGQLTPVPGESFIGVGQGKVDIALRPGTSDLYMFFDGYVVRFRAGQLVAEVLRQRTLPGDETGSGWGGISFLDANTLIYTDENRVESYTLTGDTLGERRVLSNKPMVSNGTPSRQVVTVNDQIWVREEGGFTQVLARDGRVISSPLARLGWPVVASAGGALWVNPSNPHVGYCIEPVAPEGGVVDPATASRRPPDAIGCTNLDIPLPPSQLMAHRGTISPDGHTVVLVSESFVVVAFERAPPGATQDLNGGWCPWRGTSFQLDGVRLSGPKTSLMDDLFSTITLEGTGDLRTVHLQDPDPAIAANVTRRQYDYFFKRVGDTLVVHGPATNEQRSHATRAGYLNRSGFYRYSATGSCENGAF